MKWFARTGAWLLAVAAGGWLLHAQDTAAQIEQLQRQLRQLQAEFERQQALQRQQIQALQTQLEVLRAKATGPPPASALAPVPVPTEPVAPAAAPKPWSPAEPIRVAGSGRSYLNLSLSGLFAAGSSTAADVEALQLGGHDPAQRGFTLQNLETTLDGAVDPHFRAQANLIYQISPGGESRVEVEEAFLTTTSLPANLQIKAGQFLTEFGRLNPSHPHAWAFADQPLANARFLGPDGLRNLGARLSWLMPTPFYSELFFTIQNSQGETAHSFRSDHEGVLFFGRPMESGRLTAPGDLLFSPRYAVSFDLTDTQTLLFGVSAALGPNSSGPGKNTRICGLDWFWKWKPVTHHGGFPFVSWQTELMLRRFEAAAYDGLRDPANPTTPLPAEVLLDYGLYSQLAYGFRKGWVAGLRGDWVTGERAAFFPDPDRDPRWRLSPNLTWYPSEFSKIRLQYNYDDRQNLGVDHSVWLQWEFLLGSHAAHKF